MSEQIADLIPTYLRESEIFNVYVTDMKGYFTYVNKTFQKRFSFINEDLLGVFSLETVCGEDHESCERAVEQCFANPHVPAKVQLRKQIDKGGDYEWTDWEFSLLYNKSGQPIGVLCVGYAITEQKNLIKKLLQKNAALTKVAQAHAHVLRGPLTTLLMAIGLVKRKKEAIAEREIKILLESASKLDESIHTIVNLTIEDQEKTMEENTTMK